MRIFITGGTGFIGTQVVEKLKNDGNALLLLSRHFNAPNIISGDLSDIKSWKAQIERFQPEVAIHMAWESIPNYNSKTSIKNLNYGLNFITTLAELGCERVICTGSCWEYGQQHGKLHEDLPLKPFNAFSAAKNALYLMGKEIAKENNMLFIWTRLFYVYGPRQKETSLIPYIINCVEKGKKPEIRDPSARNDFIYVEDVAQAISLLLKKCRQSSVYNVGSGYPTSVRDIIKIIYDIYGLQEQYEKVISQPKDTSCDFYADISKIQREVGWEPKTSIKEGIQKTIDYYTSNSDAKVAEDHNC